MPNWNEIEQRYRFWVKFGAREFLAWIVCATIYGLVIESPTAGENLKAWCALSLAVVTSTFIVARFWRRTPTP